MKKVSKAILIGLTVIVALGVALVLSLNAYLQSAGSQARIQEELSKALRLPLKLTNVSVSLFKGLRISGITIPNGGANFLEAASFDASYRLLPLLRGKLIIPAMSVQNPKIVWSQTADGKWILPGAEQAARTAKAETVKSEKKPEKKSSFTVIVERFDIMGGEVELLDHEKKHVAVLNDVNMTYTSLTPERVEGTAMIGKVTWADSATLENVRAPFKFAEGAFNVPEIKAGFAGGTVDGKYQTRTDKDQSLFKLALTLTKVDLDQLATQFGSPAGRTVGSLSGQVEIHGDTRQLDRKNGEGHLDLRDAQFHQVDLDLFQKIAEIFGFRDLRVHDGHGDFRLDGERIFVNKIVLNTAELQISAKGTARLDKRLNLVAQISAEDAVIQRLPAIIGDNFVPGEAGRRAIDFAITGTIDNPKTDLSSRLMGKKINTQFADVLGMIIGGDKKPNDEKVKKEDKKQEKERKKKDKNAEQNGATPPAVPATPAPSVVAPAPGTPPPQPAAANP